ncbi:MAG: hypothetical protein JNM57_11390 [Cyclobacteriaceae bacterium]|nr:hypothetical protein [Cyclobacteriaceae bacterium]
MVRRLARHTSSTFILLIGFVISCVDHDFPAPTVECSTVDEISYELQIRQIISANCSITGCHDGTLGAEKNWNIPTALQNNSDEVKRRVTLPETDNQKMPLTGSISQQQITLLVCWVEQGASINN